MDHFKLSEPIYSGTNRDRASSSSSSSSEEPPTKHNTITSETKYWSFIESLNWIDVSDGDVVGVSTKFQNLTQADKTAVIEYTKTRIDEIKEVINRAGYFTNIPDNIQTSICSHIVGRGSVEYALTFEDPDFMLRLLPENNNGKKEYRDLLDVFNPMA